MSVEQEMAQVQRALAYAGPIADDELLLPRTPEGSLARAMQPAPGVEPRSSAVLLLLYPAAGQVWLPLTVRSSHLETHRGEVSLPGGATEPHDADAAATALRETHEELGVDPHQVAVWGTLKRIYIPPSNFYLTPLVGYIAALPLLQLDTNEVAAVLHVPLRQLLDPATVTMEEWDLRGQRVQVPFFALEGYKVWGATAIVLSELVARIRKTDSYLTDETEETA